MSANPAEHEPTADDDEFDGDIDAIVEPNKPDAGSLARIDNLHAETVAGAIVMTAGNLRAMLRALSLVIAARDVPILRSIRLQVSETELIASATDLDNQIDIIVPFLFEAEPAAPWEIAFIAQGLEEAIATLPESALVSFAQCDGGLRVTWPNGVAELSATSAEDFPEFALGDLMARVDLRCDFVESLDLIRGHMSDEQTRYYLNGALFDAEGSFLAIVATDGHRLAREPVAGLQHFAQYIAEGQDQRIISKGFIDLWRALFRDRAATLEYRGFQKRIAVENTRVRLRGKVIDGTYPEYRKIIPRDCRYFLAVDRAALRRAALMVLAFMPENRQTVDLIIIEGELALHPRRTNDNRAIVTLACTGHLGEERLGLNARYLVECLDSFDAEVQRVQLCTVGGFANPILVNGDPTLIHRARVLMPVRP